MKQMMNVAKALKVLLTLSVMLVVLCACRIEPPLHLADGSDIDLFVPEVETDINVIWEIDPNWRNEWWYGWDETDLQQFGPIDEYPTPSNYEVRMYFRGEDPEAYWQTLTPMTIYGNYFRRRFPFGYHDLLFWSNIDSPDGTQVVVIDESDPDMIIASTTTTRLNYALPPVMYSRRKAIIYNSPEVFYAANEKGLHVTNNKADYDYYDTDRHVWVKKLSTKLSPLVYTYLVQVVVYNNHGRIAGMTDHAALSALSGAVSVHSGKTALDDVTVAYPMRLKKDLPARGGRMADIFGGKLTTFGLCGMDPWYRVRGHEYTGTRSDLVNHVAVNFKFSNNEECTFTYDVTKQLRNQAHGGVVTIEIDADTITIPTKGSGTGGFTPVVAPYDPEEYEFPM